MKWKSPLSNKVHAPVPRMADKNIVLLYNECVFCWDYVPETSVVPNAEGKWAESLFRLFQSVIVCGKKGDRYVFMFH